MLRRVWPSARLFLERATGLAELAERYRRAEEAPTLDEFVDRCLDELGIRWDATARFGQDPAKFGNIAIANHPFGAAEGIILLAMLRRVRPDVKVLANYLLGRLTTLRPLLLSVDPFGGPGSAVASLRGLREAVRFVKGGGMLQSSRRVRSLITIPRRARSSILRGPRAWRAWCALPRFPFCRFTSTDTTASHSN